MQTLTPEELHQQYAQTVAAYGALLPEPALRVAFAHQVDGYFRQYLLALWKAGGESVEQRQGDIYNAVWPGTSAPPPSLPTCGPMTDSTPPACPGALPISSPCSCCCLPPPTAG